MLERGESRWVDRLQTRGPPQIRQIGETMLRFVMGQPGDQAPLHQLIADQHHTRAGALQLQLRSTDQIADTHQIRVDSRLRDVQPVRGAVDIDPGGRVQKLTHQRVQPVAWTGRLSIPAQSRQHCPVGPVAGRPGLHRCARGAAGVQLRNIGTDAARCHPQGIGQ